jgi:hypothetical protein
LSARFFQSCRFFRKRSGRVVQLCDFGSIAAAPAIFLDWSSACRIKRIEEFDTCTSGRCVVHQRKRAMPMRAGAWVVELKVLHGQDPGDGHWGCPIRERWGLSEHQQLSLALEDRLAFTVTATGSYEEAAQLVAKWGISVSVSRACEWEA